MQYVATTTAIERSPKLIPSLSGKGLKQISASARHAVASTTTLPVKGISNLKTPSVVPDQYCALKDISCNAICARLMFLNHFSKLVSKSWALLSSIGNHKVGKIYMYSAGTYMCVGLTIITCPC